MRGRDIKKDGYEWANLYLIVAHNGYKNNNKFVPKVDIESFPSIKDWFDYGNWNSCPEKGSNYERLSKRSDQGETPYNLRDCAYMDDFCRQKIIWSDIATEPNFVISNEEIYFNNTCYMITGAPDWMVEYLNSDIIAWYFPNVLATDLGAGSRYFKQFVERIPVPKNHSGDLYLEFGFTDEEINFLSSFVKSNKE